MADNNLSKNKQGYGYKYTDLAQIHNYLEENNARYIQKIERIGEDDYIFTKRCFNEKWEDEWLQGSRVVQATLQGIKNPAQEQGSALTYARRYSLLMAFGLATEDDDAQSLTQKKDTKKEAKKDTEEDYQEALISPKMVQGLKLAIDNNKIDNLVVDAILSSYEYKSLEEIKNKDYLKIVSDLKGSK